MDNASEHDAWRGRGRDYCERLSTTSVQTTAVMKHTAEPSVAALAAITAALATIATLAGAVATTTVASLLEALLAAIATTCWSTVYQHSVDSRLRDSHRNLHHRIRLGQMSLGQTNLDRILHHRSHPGLEIPYTVTTREPPHVKVYSPPL